MTWGPLTLYEQRSAEQLAAARETRERGKQDQVDRTWAEENPLWSSIGLGGKEDEGRGR